MDDCDIDRLNARSFARVLATDYVELPHATCYSSGQRVPHGQANLERGTACTGHQALVAVARAQHLPAAASARAADPDST